MPKWTKEQEIAIYESGKNIIVSAGAGSGKTAVLSERVLKKIEDGVDISSLLILTFTKASANEMKNRIRNKIKEIPSLNEQLNKLEKSYITTFDSYSLSIVKKYHYLLNISSNVNIIEKSILDIKKQEFLKEVLDELYTENDSNFLKLINDFCIKDDNIIVESINNINNKLDMLYKKKDYINTYVDNYYNDTVILENINKYLDYLHSKCSYINILVAELSNYVDVDYLENILEILNPIINANTYLEYKKANIIKLPNLGKDTLEGAKETKKKIVEIINEIKELTVYDDIDEIKDVIYSTKSYAIAILEIIKRLDEKINDYKYDNDLYDFVDISKLAIKIVHDYPSVNDEIKDSFKEILVDEYQDTNDLQELFITSINNNNLYMVGDIKQSIYRFRNANPNIFKEKYDNYTNNNGGMKIDLLKNFRSRNEVVNNINLVFNYIMDNKIGGANYKESHQMVFGNTAYLKEGNNYINNDFEIYNYTNDKKEYSNTEIECFIICNDIINKINNNYQVFDKENNSLRKINYSDFAILIDRTTSFDLYKKIFLYHKIPLNVYKDEKLTSSDLVLVIKNIFNLLVLTKVGEFNQSYIYSFLSIGRSFLLDYNDNDLFEIIKNNKYVDSIIIKKINNIVKNIDDVSITCILDMIIKEFDVYNKLVNIGNIDESLVRIEYLYNLSSNLNKMGYTYIKFVEYLDLVINSDNDIKFSLNKEDNNSVKIMTIHSSKGLEYPICYFSGLAVKFNESDIKEKFIYSDKFGIITPYFKEGLGNTIYKELYKNDYINDEISEKIRLFYVAMTRAREKMIFIMPKKDSNEKYDDINNVIDSGIRLAYHSFYDMLLSIKSKLIFYSKDIPIDSLNLSKDYDNNIKDIFKHIKNCSNKIVLKDKPTILFNKIEKKHFSKKMSIIDKEKFINIKNGINIHYLLELIDFKNPCFDELVISEMEKKYINNFINSPLLKNIKDAKIYKEYEFISKLDNNINHGIIDLMIEYNDHIDIIDYKLKNINDDNYKKQLLGYQKYISNKTNKKVLVYLYSIIDNNFIKI